MMWVRWCIYLAALTGGVGWFLAAPGWTSWAGLLFVAGLPGFSILVSLPAIFAAKIGVDVSENRLQVGLYSGLPLCLHLNTMRMHADGQRIICTPENCKIYDCLGLFRFPVYKIRPAVLWRQEDASLLEQELRSYRLGDNLSRVHWKLFAKTGVMTVRETRQIPTTPGKIPPVVQRREKKSRIFLWTAAPMILCLATVILLFPPGRYEQQMQALQARLLRRYSYGETYVDLAAAGPLEERPGAVMDVVADRAQVLYLRGQAFDIYDGRNWRISDSGAGGDDYWPQGDADGGAVTIATRAVLPQLYFPYYATQGNYEFIDGGLKNTDRLREYTFRLQGISFGRYGQKKAPAQCLQLPKETKLWAETVLEKLFENRRLTDGEKAQIIQDFVRSCARYDGKTETMPAEAQDFVRWFMQASGSGYCVHFASAATVLLRGAGIPARYVTGYLVQVQAGVRKTVTGDSAHAWVEYLQDGVWQVLEATPTEKSVPTLILPTAEERPPTKGWLWAAFAVLAQVPLRMVIRCRWLRRGNANRQVVRHWKYARRVGAVLGESVSQLESLAQKAVFSQYALQEEDVQIFRDWLADARKKAQKKPLIQRLVYTAIFADNFLFLRKTRGERKGSGMKQEEKKPINWEMADPKPPVIRSGKMENRKQN